MIKLLTILRQKHEIAQNAMQDKINELDEVYTSVARLKKELDGYVDRATRWNLESERANYDCVKIPKIQRQISFLRGKTMGVEIAYSEAKKIYDSKNTPSAIIRGKRDRGISCPSCKTDLHSCCCGFGG